MNICFLYLKISVSKNELLRYIKYLSYISVTRNFDILQIPSPKVMSVPIHKAFKGKSRFVKMWKRSGRLQDQDLQNDEFILAPVFIRHLDSPEQPIHYHGPRYEIIPQDSKPKNEEINSKLREVIGKLSLLKSDLAGLNEELFDC